MPNRRGHQMNEGVRILLKGVVNIFSIFYESLPTENDCGGLTNELWVNQEGIAHFQIRLVSLLQETNKVQKQYTPF